MLHLFLTVLGTAIGIALGVMLGLHAYRLFDDAHVQEQQQEEREENATLEENLQRVAPIGRARRASSSPASASMAMPMTTASVPTTGTPTLSSVKSNNISPDTYWALMAGAGYDVHTHVNLLGRSSDKIMHQRGQLLRGVTESTQQAFTFVKDPIQRNSIYKNSTPTILNTGAGTATATGAGVSQSIGVYESKGMAVFQRHFPRLPTVIQKELGGIIDFITRDYIISWYHIVDDSIGYENEILRRNRLQRESQRDANASASASTQNSNGASENAMDGDSARNANANSNTNNMMILSTTPTRTIPFLEIFYTAITSLLGNLSNTCEEINVPHLVLYKFMNILKVNIRTFKDIRKIVLKKQEQKKRRRVRKGMKLINVGSRVGKGNGNKEDGAGSDTDADSKSSMEIAIVREYLLQGKFHRAITFGMDIPGLLFGDAKGKECPIPSTHANQTKSPSTDAAPSSPAPAPATPLSGENNQTMKISDEDAILEQRLFGNGRRMLHECELDYNRVLAYRLCKILFPRPDFASPVLRSAAVEMLASMLLTPIMGCFTPDYVNGWIITGLNGKKKDGASDNNNGGDGGIHSRTKDEDESKAANDHDDGNENLRDADHDFDLEEELNEDELDVALDVGNSLDEHDSFDNEGVMANSPKITSRRSGNSNVSDEIMALLAVSLIELQAHIDFDEAREAKSTGEVLEIRWNDQGCIETVRNLVLVIEAMIMHGVLLKKRPKKVVVNPSDVVNESGDIFPVGDDPHMAAPKVENKEYSSLIVMLMELTSDVEAFENETRSEVDDSAVELMYEDDTGDLRSIQRPKAGDLSTLRTLIAAWLHTGVVYRTLSVLMRSNASTLHPFYHREAFIREQENVDGFLRQLRGLKNVDILVDTMTILSHSPLDLHKMEDERRENKTSPGLFPATSSSSRSSDNQNTATFAQITPQSKMKAKFLDQNKNNGLGGSIKANFENNRKRLTRFVRPGESRRQSSPTSRSDQSSPGKKDFMAGAFGSSQNHSSTSHLNFHRNEALTASLRAERESRLSSFSNLKDEHAKNKRVIVETVCRSRIQSKEHRDLHNLAKGFYSNTTALSLRHIYTNSAGTGTEGKNIEETKKLQTVLVMENIATRRKWAIPDDDSSFLLRAQPVQLNVVGIHRDQRSHSLSFKKYAAYYDEPLIHVESNEFRGAKLRRKCFLRYYPSDRTASINFKKNDHKLDSNLGRLIKVETSDSLNRVKEFDRYLCNKSIREGSERTGGALSTSILASTVMDSNDFTSVPRSGKAQDFVFRASLFEEPEVELSGEKIIIEDALSVGVHRSDASSLEITDAALSVSLLLGQSYEKKNKKHFHVKCNDLHVPIIYLKMSDRTVDTGSPLSASSQKKQQDSSFKQYRLSLVRAALLVASSRKEAQLQSLLSSSPKNATRSRSDKLLQPTLTLLDFATSENRERQAILLRDLKLGINHIDKEQLRRSGILSPRHPTILRSLKVVVNGTVEAKSNQGLDLLVGPSSILYKLRCIAITEYVGVDSDADADLDAIKYGDLFREEWVVMRSFKDFTTFHKFLKSQVNSTESSAGTGAKITGLATAALTLGNQPNSGMKRKALIPSLNKAVQAGALGATKKCVEKRKEILNDYLSHLLSKRNLLNRCPELLRFVGAYDPLPESVRIGAGVMPDFSDGLGRFELSKSHLIQGTKVESKPSPSSQTLERTSEDKGDDDGGLVNTNNLSRRHSINRRKIDGKQKSKKQVDPARLAMIASIKSRVDRVKLSKVRGSFFELIRYVFDLDSANFFRSQMVTAVKTMSIAVTTSHGFKRALIELHLKYLSSRSVASYIKYMKDILWPNGIIFTPAKPLTPEESKKVSINSRKKLEEAFPDQLQAVLGNDITENGLDLFHEMLNNRLVLKSMMYMMLDTLLLEGFSEMEDILTCAQVLD